MYYYIVNPAAGDSIVSSIQDRLKSQLHSLGIDGEFNKTIGSGDAAKIARQAVEQGFKTIVAIGGDETVNEVITAVHATKNDNVAIGIVPTGKQNLMAKHLGVGDWQHACEVLATRRIQSYQLMKINSKTFIYDCTFFSEGTIVEEDNPKTTNPLWQSILDKTSNANHLPPFEYLIDIDNSYKMRGAAHQITVSNQKFLRTDLDNSLMIHIYSPNQTGDNRKILAKIFKRSAAREHQTSQIHAQNITIECKSPADTLIDGQKIGGTKFNIHIARAKVNLITNREETPGVNS